MDELTTEQERAEIERCWYCDKDGTDHKHGSGRSCGDCCGMHGGLNVTDVHAYHWVHACITAKNERIAKAEAQVAALTQQKADDDLVFNHACEVVTKLEADLAQARAELALWRSEHDPCPFSIENEALKAELAGKWISVKERLPEASNGMFLVCYLFRDKHLCHMVCAWYGGCFRGLDLLPLSTVTHYQPLPDPPTKEASSDE